MRPHKDIGEISNNTHQINSSMHEITNLSRGINKDTHEFLKIEAA
jgi:hypothetical protein